MLKKISLLLSLIILAACDNDKSEPVTPIPQPTLRQACYCTEMRFDSWSGKGSYKYYYDYFNRLNQINFYTVDKGFDGNDYDRLWRYDKFEYDAKGNIIKVKVYNSFTGDWNVALEANYSSNGLLAEKKEYTLSRPYPYQNSINNIVTYQYSSATQLLSSKTTFRDKDGGTSLLSYHYGADGVLTKNYDSSTRTDTGYRAKIEYTFDDNAHPLAASPAYLKLVGEDFTALPVNVRYPNVLKYEYSDSENGVEPTLYEPISYNATFEYNSAGYPIKETVTYLDGKVDTYTYSYDCK
ncbi:hypothetical protein [Pontibacter populi]|uniref:DUF4595 domain-containing protein n=1 Tax=Pontibacter populi TaxID=890055 RepID=A0ABV1RTA3_9BACT